MTTIRRNAALEQCELLDRSPCRVLLVQARAGQGKTVLAGQFAEEGGGPAGWVALSGLHASPTVFLEALLRELSRLAPEVSPEVVMAPVLASTTPGEREVAFRSALEAAFDGRDVRPARLVVDDAHLLLDSPESLGLLRAAVDATPDSLSWLVLTRHKLEREGKPLFRFNEYLRIDEGLLAFERREVVELYSEVFGEKLTSGEADGLLRATEGWPAGLVLLHSESRGQGLNLTPGASLDSYFLSLCLAGADEETATQAMLLAHLKEMPRELLEELRLEKAQAWLEGLAQRRLFVRRAERAGGVTYFFHHLFQESLRTAAGENLDPERLREFCRAAGDRLARHGSPEEAMLLAASVQDWPVLLDILREHGVGLLFRNRDSLVRQALADCPQGDLESSAWACLCLGRALLTEDPGRSEQLYQRAAERFVEAEDRFGELLALVLFVQFEIFVKADLRGMRDIAPRCERLLEELQEYLPPKLEQICLEQICYAICYGTGDFTHATKTLEKCSAFSSQIGFGSLPPELLIVASHIWTVQGNEIAALRMLQKHYHSRNDASLSPVAKILFNIVYLNTSHMRGRLDDYASMRDELLSNHQDALQNSYFDGFIRIWDIDLVRKKDDQQGVLLMVDEALSDPRVAGISHISSLCYMARAMALAMLGESDKAWTSISQALRLRAKCGGLMFIHLGHSVTACVLSLIGDHRRAEHVFARCLRRSDQFGEYSVRAQLYAYRAHMRLDQGRMDEAMADFRAMLATLAVYGNTYFFYWSDRVMLRLFGEAARRGEMTAQAEKILRRQLDHGVHQGEIVPLLRVRSIGELRLSAADGAALDRGDLTAGQEALLRLLLQRPDRSLAVERVMAALWPEQAQGKARRSFDTALSRLRKLLDATFGSGRGKAYLRTRSGVLRLACCRVDAEELRAEIEEGLRAARENEPWHADMRFRAMRRLVEAAPGDAEWPFELAEAVSRAALAWADILVAARESQRAVEALQSALRPAPLDEPLNMRLYRLLLDTRQSDHAARHLREYADRLLEAGFSQDDVEEVLAGFGE
ncbi:AAA family ATPase [Desulfohalovibrio reitneri]|uniref:AAA family ATPase n=1 Tax=Desulfohalovibrio reitneri TaxID=1307759 RepID=UPI0004A6BC3D|nr:AAA family ATPase [Desulfohalovibrio reitneri]